MLHCLIAFTTFLHDATLQGLVSLVFSLVSEPLRGVTTLSFIFSLLMGCFGANVLIPNLDLRGWTLRQLRCPQDGQTPNTNCKTSKLEGEAKEKKIFTQLTGEQEPCVCVGRQAAAGHEAHQ